MDREEYFSDDDNDPDCVFKPNGRRIPFELRPRPSENDVHDFIENTDKNVWVFSYGGCGTNYLRKVFNCFRFKFPDNWKGKRILVDSVHLKSPPEQFTKDFVAIYVFGNPILSAQSISSRKMFRIVNIIAQENVLENRRFELKDTIADDQDIFKFQEYFQNWMEAERSYPIIYIKYDDMTAESLKTICNDLKEKLNIDFNNDWVEEFKPRRSSYEQIGEEDLKKLLSVHGKLVDEIANLPQYWIKMPKGGNTI